MIHVKDRDRVVFVRGLAEREVPADYVIWPIVFKEAGNDLSALYETVQAKTGRLKAVYVGKEAGNGALAQSLNVQKRCAARNAEAGSNYYEKLFHCRQKLSTSWAETLRVRPPEKRIVL